MKPMKGVDQVMNEGEWKERKGSTWNSKQQADGPDGVIH
jgi:hypothetical protein